MSQVSRWRWWSKEEVILYKRELTELEAIKSQHLGELGAKKLVRWKWLKRFVQYEGSPYVRFSPMQTLSI